MGLDDGHEFGVNELHHLLEKLRVLKVVAVEPVNEVASGVIDDVAGLGEDAQDIVGARVELQ